MTHHSNWHWMRQLELQFTHDMDADVIKKFKVPELRAELAKRGLPDGGKKAALVKRLQLACERLTEDDAGGGSAPTLTAGAAPNSVAEQDKQAALQARITASKEAALHRKAKVCNKYYTTPEI